ncbi:HlyD family secretion protein [Salmonella enterica subsp. enterica serovar Infantis]|nr:HlyD family secretion protein [Salmonella enterica]EHA1743114.1 HlyD family secretion protein [Salmonella enterica subsp. enterica serovar Javiana]EHC4525246.1 HlyD family secretion protein [Salmonella enterica subsp. enterica serovar Infantis]ECL4818271.1 HlyD family secretion protein [Salmonella enterica]EHJ8320772.1 HlyD family secretion protein [Salmonella enterica subsp. enterica serovar Infantis]
MTESVLDKQEQHKKRVFAAFAFLLLVIALIVGGWWWFFWRGVESTDDAFIDGYLSRISPQVAGQIMTIEVRDNQYVTKNTPLIRLDPRDEEIALKKEQAAYAVIQAQLQQNQAEQAALRALTGQTQADVKVAQAEYQRDQKEYQRYLESGNAVSKSALDKQATQAKISAATLLARQKSLNSSQAKLVKAEAGMVEIKALLKQAQAAIDNAQLKLSYMSITAPVDGFVTKRTVSVGNYVTVGKEMLTLINNSLWVTANFKESQLRKMRPGQRVDMSVDAFPGHVFQGRVDSIQRATGSVFSILPAENATGNYVKVVQRVPVRIVFTDKDISRYPLSPGMSVVPRVYVTD